MIGDTDYNELIKSYPVLGDLPWDLRQELKSDGRRVSISAGEVLFDLHSPCQLFLFVNSGAIRVVISTRSGKEILLYRVRRGEACVLTTSCLLGNSQYPARGVVEQELQGVAFSQALFIRLVIGSPHFRGFVFRFFGDRLARLMTLIEEVAFGKLEQRLAGLLLKKGGVLETTHQMLADELGSVREVVSRILKEFQGQGIVRLERGQIQVLDEQGLARIARPQT